ncbi:MAG: hypothetical protein V4714_19165 [Bacteroidota bacterium]
MMYNFYRNPWLLLLIATVFSSLSASQAQTPTDGLMMPAGNLCAVGMYSHDSWKNYWEGSLKRENLNLGTVTTQSVTAMAALGVTDKINVLVAVPYVWTKASAGTLHGQSGLQDLVLNLKWQALQKESAFGKLSLYAVAGFSTPASNYTPDFQPMSIGMGSTTGSLKGIVHYRTKFGAFVTLQGGYTVRNNIKLDRASYFTDHLIFSNQVAMPNVIDGSVRAGYLGPRLTAEAVLSRFTPLDGFDIRRNDMPFPSNLMQATRVGANFIWRPRFAGPLSFQTGFNYTTHGRNMGQSTTVYGGLLYIFQLWKKSTDPKDTFFQNNN